MRPIRYAIVSPAAWGRRYLEALKGSAKMSLTAGWGRSAENVARIVSEYGGVPKSSFEALVTDPDVDAVLLPTPHFLHYPQAKAALLAGKHVFVEKPLANRFDESAELQALSEARRLVLAVGLQGRRTAGIRSVKALLASGQYGRPALVTVAHGSPQVQLTYKSGDWETSDVTMPGGILDQLGVHYAEVLQFLFGRVRRVSGFCNRGASVYPTVDTAAGAYEFESGLVAVHAVHQISAYVSELRIFTDRGLLQVNRMGRELIWEPIADLTTAKAGAVGRQVIPLEGPEMTTTALREELEEFADCVRNGGKPEVGAAEAIAAHRLVRAILWASETGRAVEPDQLLD